MPEHEHFEELAAAAASGELDPSSRRELDVHLLGCPNCKRIFDEYVELHAPLLEPVDSEMDALIESRRNGLKVRVLQEFAARGARAVAKKQPVFDREPQTTSWNTGGIAWAGLASAAALGFVFWLGVRYERYALGQTAEPQLSSSAATASSAQAVVAVEAQPEPQKSAADEQYVQVAEELKVERSRNGILEGALAGKTTELTEAQQQRLLVQQQLEAETEEARRTRSLLDAKTEQLQQLEGAKAKDSSTVVALQVQVQDLTQKLSSQAESLDRERSLLANGRDIRDIIGARNLHIIDVYDTGPEGRTSKSFARAFYTEGKSLVFYAYDLPMHGTDEGKFVYTAWGETNGDKSKVQKLGILLNDDKGQKRWALNFSDPKVLNEIDSVFVTLERVDADSLSPKGKRMLTAYLDSQVNHP